MITPLYYEIKALGLLNTRFAVILPLIGLFMPFGVYWMRTHFVNVPKELSEAAQIDGASEWKQFWLVQVPIAKPAIMSLTILFFLWTWNQFLLPVVLVQDPLQRTMAGALGAFQGQWGHRHSAALRRGPADPRADHCRLPRLPAPVRGGAPAGGSQGLDATRTRTSGRSGIGRR